MFRTKLVVHHQEHSILRSSVSIVQAGLAAGTVTGFPETSSRSYRISRTFEQLVYGMWTTLRHMNEHKDVAHSVPKRNMRGVIFIVIVVIIIIIIIIINSSAGSVLNTCRIVRMFLPGQWITSAWWVRPVHFANQLNPLWIQNTVAGAADATSTTIIIIIISITSSPVVSPDIST